jgi:hypothetical protein
MIALLKKIRDKKTHNSYYIKLTTAVIPFQNSYITCANRCVTLNGRNNKWLHIIWIISIFFINRLNISQLTFKLEMPNSRTSNTCCLIPSSATTSMCISAIKCENINENREGKRKASWGEMDGWVVPKERSGLALQVIGLPKREGER